MTHLSAHSPRLLAKSWEPRQIGENSPGGSDSSPICRIPGDLARSRKRRKGPRGAVILFLVLIASPVQAANNFASNARKIESKGPLVAPAQKIPVGEKLAYEVSWMGVNVGIGTLEIKATIELEGRRAFHVVAIAETNEVLSKIYPVHDEVHSWIDAETFQSLQFQKTVSEGFYRANEVTKYDAANKKGHYESLKNGTKKEFDIHVPAHDIISAFYWARRQPLEPGKTVKTIVNSDEKDWDLEIETLRRDTTQVRGWQAFDTLLIEPKTRLKGVLEKRGRVWIYLKNDPSRIPILIQFKTPFGPIVGVLKKENT